MQTFTSVQPRAGGFLVSEEEDLRSREEIVVLSGQVVKAGHVLGKVLVGASAAAVANSGNTGNGTFGTITVGQSARRGTYQLVFIGSGATAAFELQDPNRQIVGNGAVGTAFSEGGIGFTIATGGTNFANGDRFLINISGGTEKYKEYNPANTDGSQAPAAISWDAYDATAGDLKGAAIARDAAVNVAELTWFSGATSGQIAAAIAQMAGTPMRVIARPSV